MIHILELSSIMIFQNKHFFHRNLLHYCWISWRNRKFTHFSNNHLNDYSFFCWSFRQNCTNYDSGIISYPCQKHSSWYWSHDRWPRRLFWIVYRNFVNGLEAITTYHNWRIDHFGLHIMFHFLAGNKR